MKHLGALTGLPLQSFAERKHLTKRIQQQSVAHSALDLAPVVGTDVSLTGAAEALRVPMYLLEL